MRAPSPRFSVRAFQPGDLPALVAFWNVAFATRRNFRPITADEYRSRVLENPAFDPAGLLLAWEQTANGAELAGLAHAFRPPPAQGLYLAWPRKHELALLYVRPSSRRQGLGTRLLRAAEEWLTYCPVYVASVGQPTYGCVEGPRRPFFGSSEHLALSAHDGDILRFLARNGYAAFEPGSISMTLRFADRPLAGAVAASLPPAATRLGLRPTFISHTTPFTGHEPPDRLHYTLLGNNDGLPFWALGLVMPDGLLVAHLSWFPMSGENGQGERRAAITNVRVAPQLRGSGIGTWLLDHALYTMRTAPWPMGGYAAVELNTHAQHFARAVEMYERRGFEADDLWVTLVKT